MIMQACLIYEYKMGGLPSVLSWLYKTIDSVSWKAGYQVKDNRNNILPPNHRYLRAENWQKKRRLKERYLERFVEQLIPPEIEYARTVKMNIYINSQRVTR